MHSIKSTTVTISINTLDVTNDNLTDSDSVVSPEILALVFKGKPLPFQTNPDGSVDMTVYRAWLEDAWKMALKAFDENFDSVEHDSASD